MNNSSVTLSLCGFTVNNPGYACIQTPTFPSHHQTNSTVGQTKPLHIHEATQTYTDPKPQAKITAFTDRTACLYPQSTGPTINSIKEGN